MPNQSGKYVFPFTGKYVKNNKMKKEIKKTKSPEKGNGNEHKKKEKFGEHLCFQFYVNELGL